MSNVVSGVVDKIWEKDGKYSIIIDDVFYSTYTTKPKCNEGDTITMNFTKRGRFCNADPKSIEINDAAPAAVASSEAGGKGKNKQDIIQYQAARNTAMEFLKITLEQGAVKLSAKQDAKYDELMGLLHEVTDQFFAEAANLGVVEMPDVIDNSGKYGDE